MYALELRDTLKSIDIPQLCSDVAKDAEDEMVKLNEDQLQAGLRSDNTEIEPAYTRFTIFKKETEKEGLAAVTDRVTLFDTGEHYAKLYAEVKGQTIEWGSKDKKSPALEKKYKKD